MKKKVIKLVGLVTFLQLSVFSPGGEAAVFKNKVTEKKTSLSPGVIHAQESYQTGSVYESVNILEVNLNDPFTKLELGVPSPINSLKTTSAFAKENSYFGHRVVGATNASFFNGNGYPANLLAVNNEIKNYGTLKSSGEGPTNKRVAFGIDSSGKAIIDYFNMNIAFKANGKTYEMDRVNGERSANQTTLYTSAKKSTGTNEWGVEVVIENATKSTKVLSLGDQITGTIAQVTKTGERGNSTIPANGFVISTHNRDVASELVRLAVGTEVSLNMNVDSKWLDAQYIIAAGPLLVKDQKVHISMPINLSFAAARHPRTALGIDKTGKNIFMVTVDGRRSGHSNGTNLENLANLLISKGAVAAINLDGGGSTAMAISQPGSLVPQLINRPADGSERRVSAILQAVNTAPPGIVKSMKLNAASLDVIKGSTTKVNVTGAIDVYMNPAKVSEKDVTWHVEGNIGKMEGSNFIATAGGAGKIVASAGQAQATMNVKVIDPKDKPLTLHPFDRVTDWEASSIRARATLGNSSANETTSIGKAGMKLTYDFTMSETGTKAAYVNAKKQLPIIGLPTHIGTWVYGDGKKNWLRGNVKDGLGKTHTINFTGQGGLDWKGWKYVQAEIPANLPLPLKLEQVYIVQPTAALQSKGEIYFRVLQAVYSAEHKESIYIDVAKNHWAYASIKQLNQDGLIKGYPNGTFQAEKTITRAEAASLIARKLRLSPSKQQHFSDVNKNHYAYNDIAAVAEKGIVIGKGNNKFHPDGQLTRAEMATVLQRAFELTGTTKINFKDVNKKHWAYKHIETLVANELTTGFSDNTFKPDDYLKRSEFATFLDRVSAMGK